MNNFQKWYGFKRGVWNEEINVSNFIKLNYKAYDGDENFLQPISEKTAKILSIVQEAQKEEIKKGIYDVDTKTVAGINNFKAGYIDKDNEVIVGLQTDKLLKRIVNPFGGMRMVRHSLEAYGFEADESIEQSFKYHKTHNDGVFSAYTEEMKKARRSGVITGLPDAYGRGRIIGDYRRIALYGIDKLIEDKKEDQIQIGKNLMDQDNIRLMEEVNDQIYALKDLKAMAKRYGFDISLPAGNAKEAIQWLYFGYLASVKEQNGAAMSLGRTSTFIDVYIERDLETGELDESTAQELIDQFVLKLRLVRHLRTPDYNELFGGDPTWVTESIGGVDTEGNHLVTKSSYRFLHTLYNLNPAPEPNLTVLWSRLLPENFKKYCAKVSIETDSIQYENDDIMRPIYDDDYAIACCVSALQVGKQMQYFGARCNLPKLLILALNGGYDIKSKQQLGPEEEIYDKEYLDYEEVMERFKRYESWLTNLYVNTMNVIHYMHDKYSYENIQMALHDSDVERVMAFGVAGLSVIADSLSAIKHAKVKTIRDDLGYIVDYEIEGDFPKFGNDDDRVDLLAHNLVRQFFLSLRQTKTYRNALHSLSVLTITSNVVYGKKTGNTPDGRRSGEPFAPGANPQHNREFNGALASLNSVAKLPYNSCRDGISNTFTMVPNSLGKDLESRQENLVNILDGYFKNGGHHINVNVLDRDKLIRAMEFPEEYPNLTIRVSGYATNFIRLSREQQEEVIKRTFHES